MDPEELVGHLCMGELLGTCLHSCNHQQRSNSLPVLEGVGCGSSLLGQDGTSPNMQQDVNVHGNGAASRKV